MILYTAVPKNQIFSENPRENMIYRQKNNIFIGLLQGKNGLFVENLVSTNPFDYLKSELSPGTLYSDS